MQCCARWSARASSIWSTHSARFAVKRSRSGTRSPAAKRARRPALGLLLAVIAVLAFLASFVLGIGRGDEQRPAPASDATAEPIAVPDSRVRVQVLNGSKRSGLARLATDQLRDAGFDVVSIGNASSQIGRAHV